MSRYIGVLEWVQQTECVCNCSDRKILALLFLGHNDNSSLSDCVQTKWSYHEDIEALIYGQHLEKHTSWLKRTKNGQEIDCRQIEAKHDIYYRQLKLLKEFRCNTYVYSITTRNRSGCCNAAEDERQEKMDRTRHYTVICQKIADYYFKSRLDKGRSEEGMRPREPLRRDRQIKPQ